MNQSKQNEAKYKRYWIIGIVIAILVAALLIWNSGIFVKNAAAATVGDRSYSVAEMEYYYHTVANSTINTAKQYQSYGVDMGYNPDLPPEEQMYNEEEGKTYKDYFMDSALEQMQRNTILCDQAAKESYTLSSKGQKAVEQNLSYLETYSLQSGTSKSTYLKMVYGRYMTQDLFERLITDSILAEEYAQHKTEQFDYTDKELEAYYDKNADSLDSYEYRSCYINYKAEDKTDAEGKPIEPSEEEVAAAMKDASKEADSMIAEIKSGTDFNKAAVKYVDEQSAESYKDPEYNHQKDTLGSAIDPTIADWMMEKGRITGDITAIEVPNTGYCVVQFLDRDKAEDSYQTANYRNILVLAETTKSEQGPAVPTEDQLAAAKVQAEALLDEWKSGDATADSFAALASEKSADDLTKEDGGMNEKANRDAMTPDTAAWLFDADRKKGDAAVVEHQDETGAVTGYDVLYMESFGEIRWKFQAASNLGSADYDKWYEKQEGSYPAAVTDQVKHIPTISITG